MIEVSIIIVNYNGCQQTRRCIESIQANQGKSCFEIIVVDNNSKDGSVQTIKEQYPDIKVVPLQQNIGFGNANNIGAKESKSEFLFFVNNDTIFQKDIMTPLKEYLKSHESVGAIAPMLLNADGSYQLSYGKYPSLMNEIITRRNTAKLKSIPINRSSKRVDWVSFAAVMVKRPAFDRIGGFDKNYFMYFEDADFCLRLMNAGYQTIYSAEYSLIHAGGGSWSSIIIDKIKIEYRRSQIYYYTLHRPLYELIVLRIYLTGKYLLYCINNDARNSAVNILKMALGLKIVDEKRLS